MISEMSRHYSEADQFTTASSRRVGQARGLCSLLAYTFLAKRDLKKEEDEEIRC